MVQTSHMSPSIRCILGPHGGMHKNTSDKMLTEAMADADDLYWATEKPALDPASPKRKWVQLKEELLDDMVSTIKSSLSIKKTWKSALKHSENKESNKTNKGKNSLTIASQVMSILQLTKQVNEIKQMNKMFLTCFNQLAEQMVALLAALTTTPHLSTPLEVMAIVNPAQQHETIMQCRNQWGPPTCMQRTNNGTPTTMDPVPALDEVIINPVHHKSWGNTMEKKQPNNIWIVFQNVRGLIPMTDSVLKLTILQQFIQHHNIDIFSFAKHNVGM